MENVLQACFHKQVALQPEATALEASGACYSYAAFSSMIHGIAKTLESRGIQKKAIIVFNDHSAFSYAAVMAINFSGNAVLPIEQTWPVKRLLDVVAAVRPAGMIVTQITPENKALMETVQHACGGFVYEAATQLFQNPISGSFETYENIAYVIFTSGSTGVPKGVPVKQSSLNAFINYFLNEYEFGTSDRFLQVYDITFDVAYFSFLVPLCCGSCCCILNAQKSVPKYLSILNDLLTRNITVVSMVPTILHYIKKYLKNQTTSTIRYSFFSGDALFAADAVAWQHFIGRGAIHNFYGPTETTIVCTRYIWAIEKADEDACNGVVPLGRPFPGMHFKIVDEKGNAVADGETGELAFGGVQVIDHYLHHQNAAAFFEYGSMRFYKTGDRAHVSASGNLVFHGRNDSQVKINGYRLELGEVEEALRKATQRKAVVLSEKNGANVTF